MEIIIFVHHLKKQLRKMKSVLSLLVIMSIAICGISQADVTSAYNANRDGKFVKAAEYIEKALGNEKAIVKEKTWRYRGDIYYNISLDTTLTEKFPNALFTAKESYLKAKELDKKGSYKREVETGLDNIRKLAMNVGINGYNSESYMSAAKHFQLSSDLSEYFGITDTMAIFNAGIAYEKAEMGDDAITQYMKCGDLEYNVPAVYLFSSYIYKNRGDKEKAREVIQMARTKYPEDKDLIIEELNYYLEGGNDEEAKKNLVLAIEKDPENKILHFALGTINDKMGDVGGAIASYERAIEIDGNYFDALYNLGAFHFNSAVGMVNDANEIPPSQSSKYAAAIEEANATFDKSLPYLEKALEIKPEDIDTLNSLKNAYARVGNDDKYSEVKEILDNLLK